ncbi:MAG TPA: ATP-binding cassette domain-containing protein, partial [Allosphingosinicella sp.]|nr:ATP-binding cassette domain-containing protein [Allosphingosinicella sp.]
MKSRPRATDTSIRVERVSKRFSAYPALSDVSLEIAPGEFVALLGPSGSGKTTLLRIIAGLDFPDSGRILFGDEDVTDKAAAKRGIGFVFQHYALFNHMNVERNIAFGLDIMKRRQRPKRDEIRARVEGLLRLVQLEGYGKRFPAQLSGGQRQRVALARALVNRPTALLLDEPLGALDLKLRKEMQAELKRIQRETGTAFVYVTHDQEEALTMSDRIAVMDGGRVEQVDAQAERVRDADEVGDEGGHRALIQRPRRVDLLDPAAIHDGDPVRH